MFTTTMLLLSLTGAQVVAQLTQSSPPPTPGAAMPATVDTLNNGACMDSPRSVPLALQPPAVRSRQILRIDKVVSTQTNLQNEVIGFLYTLQDGSTWLGQRTPDYMSGADARAINQVLASTHMPDQPIAAFPPTMRFGVATKYQQYFRVEIPAGALAGLQIRLDGCVAWPPGRELPDPSM
ncbi:MAG TPA: hypothetical protein VNF68_08750 [Candidatus Baltobacteraceae bacterium]|nr:hypothetical protein [Candidatus Baltobacteraceae bacterium]